MGITERRAREREARRTSVLDAARLLVRENGFNGTTTKQIARACELSEATLFFYFKSKDEILVSLLFEGVDFLASGIEEISAQKLAPRDVLDRLWKFFAQVRLEHPEYFHVFSYLAHPQSTASVTEEVRSEIARRSGDNFRRLADLLQDSLGVPNGRLAADVLWGSFVGLMLLRDSRVNMGARPHPDEDDLREVFEFLVRGFEGLAPEQSTRRTP